MINTWTGIGLATYILKEELSLDLLQLEQQLRASMTQ